MASAGFRLFRYLNASPKHLLCRFGEDPTMHISLNLFQDTELKAMPAYKVTFTFPLCK